MKKVNQWGKPAIRLHVGDIIDIPEGAKHWHGATSLEKVCNHLLSVPSKGRAGCR